LIYSKYFPFLPSYFNWTQSYKRSSFTTTTALCRLCQFAIEHRDLEEKQGKHVIPDIFKWWGEEAKCIDQFVTKNLLKI
jgi:hypothetical protein